MPTPQRLFWNCILLLVSLVGVALLLEAALRLSGIQKVISQNPPIYRSSEDPELSYELIPSNRASAYGARVTTNSLGFRSPDLPQGARPFVILGDSLVFGFGVQDTETVGARLQKLLPTQHVLSAGVCGYNGVQERAVFEKTLAPLKPTALVLVFMPNDMDETLVLDREGYFRPRSDRDPRTFLQKLHDDLHKPGSLPIPFKTFLQTHSALFQFMERSTKRLAFRSHASSRNIFDDPLTDAGIDAYIGELHRITAAAGGIPRMFVVWPEENLHVRARERLTRAARDDGFTVVDLYEIFGNRYDSLGWDGHPNAFTTDRTAKVLFDAMKVAPGFRALIGSGSLR